MKKIPELIIDNFKLYDFVYKNISSSTLIVADDHNFPTLHLSDPISNKQNLILVKDCLKREIYEIKKNKEYNKIIAIGGCTALDFGRACAKPQDQIILIPSILSTSCISVNRSIIYFDSEYESIVTPTPAKVFISSQLLLEGDTQVISKWTHSGFGDLFANISAAIDFQFHQHGENIFKREMRIVELLRHIAPESMDAIEWAQKGIGKFDENLMEELAKLLHHSSVYTILREDTKLSSAGEHDLYYSMMKLHKYSRENPTHGELVTVGTLLTAKILGEKSKNNSLFLQLKDACKKIGIPINYNELKEINVTKDHILQGMANLRNKRSFLNIFFQERLLDECYG